MELQRPQGGEGNSAPQAVPAQGDSPSGENGMGEGSSSALAKPGTRPLSPVIHASSQGHKACWQSAPSLWCQDDGTLPMRSSSQEPRVPILSQEKHRINLSTGRPSKQPVSTLSTVKGMETAWETARKTLEWHDHVHVMWRPG